MADVRIHDISATATTVDGTNDYMVVDSAASGGTTKKLLLANITDAHIDSSSPSTSLGLISARRVQRAKIYIGNFVANAAKRLGDIFGDGTAGAREYYITRAAVAANAGTAKTDTTVFARIDNPAAMTNAEADAGTDTTAKTPNAAQLKRAVDAHASAAIRTGTGASSGIVFRTLTQSQYDGITSPDANTMFIITG